MLLCSGKIRWDLVNARSQAGKDGQVAIIAVERLYPLPTKELVKQLRRFDGVDELRWVQDEPANQGAWPFMALNLPQRLAEAEPGKTWRLTPMTRPESSAPSVGSASVHLQQQRALMERLRLGAMYFTTGIEELGGGETRVTLGWLAEQLRTLSTFIPNSRLPWSACHWLARLDDEDE